MAIVKATRLIIRIIMMMIMIILMASTMRLADGSHGHGDTNDTIISLMNM